MSSPARPSAATMSTSSANGMLPCAPRRSAATASPRVAASPPPENHWRRGSFCLGGGYAIGQRLQLAFGVGELRAQRRHRFGRRAASRGSTDLEPRHAFRQCGEVVGRYRRRRQRVDPFAERRDAVGERIKIATAGD